MSIIANVIRGSNIRIHRCGYEFDTIYVVAELTGDPDQILINAALTAGVPRIGDPHPTVPSYVEDISVDPESSTVARVRVTYKNPSPRVDSSGVTIEYNSSRTTRTTDKDKDGNLLTVYYDVDAPAPPAGDIKYKKVGEIDVPTTERTIVVTYVASDDPASVIDAFDDSVNADGWNGEDPRCWHCVASARSSNNRVTWEVRFEFYLNLRTWDRLIGYRDENGKIPDNATETNGRALKRCIREADFKALPFTV